MREVAVNHTLNGRARADVHLWPVDENDDIADDGDCAEVSDTSSKQHKLNTKLVYVHNYACSQNVLINIHDAIKSQ